MLDAKAYQAHFPDDPAYDLSSIPGAPGQFAPAMTINATVFDPRMQVLQGIPARDLVVLHTATGLFRRPDPTTCGEAGRPMRVGGQWLPSA